MLANFIRGGKTYAGTSPGIYRDNTLTFIDPANEFRVTKGAKSSKTKRISGAVTRVIGADITTGDTVVRKTLPVTLQFQVDPGFTAAQVVAAIQDLAAFCTETTVNSVLMGDN